MAVLYRGRAVPLVSRVLEHASAQVGTEQLLPVLAEVKGLLDFLGLHDVRLLADRGFCDTALMGWLRVCGWHFRIRIKSSLILAAPDGQRVCTIGKSNSQRAKRAASTTSRSPDTDLGRWELWAVPRTAQSSGRW
ncbi:transposase [Deinococcus sp. QL22]|uniref:transposase n=1 Tax=Deinococcus sp. QL22 TaxID=2939437 RepID=UPI0020171D51|nr:transposase [Deinococcus sp. QL22]UQN09383.1 transposase [Deinococcus sp. QL22]